ncbi:ERG4/ERG24 ergosterol biosynthesis protein [Pleomassaria siparia CBS 279.74]|uniref:Delta(24(24(1)))-sterol reductase n=1 Tax=Pleomassaria siparia CBS 279.74 TaxID=1314801 RepID=A0A6G1K9S6_9PLEO|nr:ERG4/ERG24 ergosterol biosynthesis protein [Pleomassaria siparia CBS 279.74]
MAESVTRSRTGRTQSKPETPGRNKYTRKSGIPNLDSAAEYSSDSTPDSLSENDTNGGAGGYAKGAALKAELGATIKAEKAEKAHIKELDNPAIDSSHKTEFGGSLGMSAMMIGFPALMYYMWIGAYFYDGKFPTPAADQSWGDFFGHLVNLVKTHAYPSNRAWTIYWYFGMTQMAFYMLLPGVYRKGQALPHLNGKRLDYYCSGMWSFYTSIVLSLVLHFTGVFKLYTLIDEFGPIMSVAILSGFLCSTIAYVSAYARGATLRTTGYPIYDFFLGAELNPRLFGILDFKMFLEVRIPWYILFFLSLGTCLRQYERYGYVSGEAVFLLLAQYLYAGACSKGEHLIITTWDMYYEKLGFMLIFWNMAGVPLSYCHCILYVAQHHPDEYQWPSWFIGLLTVAYLGAYYVWDTCNSQKNQFRLEDSGKVQERTTFPYFKYGRIANPKTIETAHGKKLLVDGWYGKARKVHYACDFFFALSWGLITGFKSPFPWFYSVFFAGMIIHRARRDIERCRETYGDAWKEYERRVPYLFIPGVF